jgi:predicted N-formylglutamate amidohydrolase
VSGRNTPRDAFIITCEHGGNRIPAAYRPYFAQHRSLLATHRGYDAGALVMAKALAGAFAAPLIASTVSRLLIDLNRSLHHPRAFFEATRDADASLRAKIVAEHYQPYRTEVEHLVARSVARGHRVIHISSHSFTPVLDGIVRVADVGLLYDPIRRGEVALCARWKASLAGCIRRSRSAATTRTRGKATV